MSEKNSVWSEVLEWIKTILIAVVIAVVIKVFFVDATRVEGNSMLNTLHSDDMLFVNKIEKHFGGYDRGDIVILQAPDQPDRLYIKRIVGLPGETISLSQGDVYIDGNRFVENYISTNKTLQTSESTEWKVGDNEYFVMGDNRLPGASNDSRNFGPISADTIVGHAFLRFYPFDSMGFVDKN